MNPSTDVSITLRSDDYTVKSFLSFTLVTIGSKLPVG